MKSLINYIIEQKNTKLQQKLYKYTPKTKKELKDLIGKRVKEEGNNVNLNDIDVSNIKDMSNLFCEPETKDFNGDISGWDVSNVTNMHEMFLVCSKFEGKGLENWDVSNVTNMYKMFQGCHHLNCDLSDWNVSNVTNMESIFAGCISFEGKGLENWDVSNVTNMREMIFNCKKFNTDISGWDVSNVTNMQGMFWCCEKFEGKGLENWDVSNVTDMRSMFVHCKKLDCNLSKWDVSNVTNIYSMFHGCNEFEGKGLENWDVSNVKDMSNMFYDCENLNCDLSKWNISNKTKTQGMFFGCPIKDEYKPVEPVNIKTKKIINDITKLLSVTNGYKEDDVHTFIKGVTDLYDHYEGQYDDFDDVIDSIFDDFYYEPKEFEKYKNDVNNKFFDFVNLKKIIKRIILNYDKNALDNFDY